MIFNQLDGESNKAYSAFMIFRSLPPHERSLKNAYQQYLISLGKGKKNRNPTASFRGWSENFDWTERAKSWDRHVSANIRREEAEKLFAEQKSAVDFFRKASMAYAQEAARYIDNTRKIREDQLADQTATPSELANTLRMTSQTLESSSRTTDKAFTWLKEIIEPFGDHDFLIDDEDQHE